MEMEKRRYDESASGGLHSPPEARLHVDGIPAPMQNQFGVGPREEARFVQLTAEPFRYRDAIRFNNGQEIPCRSSPTG